MLLRLWREFGGTSGIQHDDAQAQAHGAPGRDGTSRHLDDGRGLRLVVRPERRASWILRYQLNGKRRDMGLGP